MTTDAREVPEVLGLPSEVVGRILTELGGRGDKVISCLRTAAAFLDQAREDSGDGLRLAESAAYNLREAFDTVVEGRPTPEGGVGEVIEVWTRYEAVVQEPGADVEAARAELDGVLRRLAQEEAQAGWQSPDGLAIPRSPPGEDGVPAIRGRGDCGGRSPQPRSLRCQWQ